jgi:lipopolysaccharide export LptBFGC system permease protein LptF
MIVFVLDYEGKPLLPTHPARARKLLNQNKAKIKQVVPFTIQLNKTVKNPVGEFEVGIDDGAKHVGIAIKNNKTNEIVFRGQLDHRQDVSRKVEQRRNYRRSRRTRKLRYRQPRFSNRIRSKIAPSIRQRKEAIIRVSLVLLVLMKSALGPLPKIQN